MYKLNSEKQISANKEIITKILVEYSISNFTFQPINEGIANSSFIIQSDEQKYVLRIYAQGKNDKDILFEINFQDYLRSNGIPIPAIYPNKNNKELTIIKENGLEWQCILMEFIEGQSVTPHPSTELNIELAKLQARMHILGIDFTNTINNSIKLSELQDSLAKEIKETPVTNNDVPEFIERVKNFNYQLDSSLPYGYNHLDIDFDGNVITKDNHIVGIIDFEDLKYSPPVVCLGYTLWNILDDEGIDAVINYLNAYEEIRPLTSLESKTLPHVIFFRNYVIGILRLLLWKKDRNINDILDILQLEKEIPKMKFK